MSYLWKISGADLATLDGKRVSRIEPVTDKNTKELLKFRLTVDDDELGAVLRHLRPEEMAHLFETEALKIDMGYFSLPRQTDRELYGNHSLAGATRKQRDAISRKIYLAGRVEHYRNCGVPLTREGIDSIRSAFELEYNCYQARAAHGTDTLHPSHTYNPLPKSATLLEYRRLYQGANCDPRVFLPKPLERIEAREQETEDFAFVLKLLSAYACSTQPAKSKVAEDTVEILEKVNEERIENGYRRLINVMSARTYERWIDRYLDAYTVALRREGAAAATAKFRCHSGGMSADFPGQWVQCDAWRFHVATLDVTREKWLAMSEDERAKVKRVYRWLVMMIDVATRCILGFAICSAPNQDASLEALRMCYTDKTHLLRAVGIKDGHYNIKANIHLMATDSGSEFGKTPFGGARFAAACKTLRGSYMNTVAGVPELRAHIERAFRTWELKFARQTPGASFSNPQVRNDRKPHEEACLTDTDLAEEALMFIHELNHTAHRGLGNRPPISVWEELTARPEFDPIVPGPQDLREACGRYVTGSVGPNGIRFANNDYANELTVGGRLGKSAFGRPGEKIEFMVDPADLGSISVSAGGELVSVRCVDKAMCGKSLRTWAREQAQARALALAATQASSGHRKNAKEMRQAHADAAARRAGVEIHNYTDEEVEILRREHLYGRDRLNEGFVGVDEVKNPIDAVPTSRNPSADPSNDVPPDHQNPRNRLGNRKKSRPNRNWEQ